MEYVIGVPITEYCDKHKLTTRQRLELFVRVCEGVQHAHQKAIIHRDLKPSNILVGEVDGKPMPRIIDFGVAKATSQRLTPDTMYTRVGAIVGTPGYMSPEQADSAGADVDTRTDVYSLGVVLYELLVGALPLDFRKLPLERYCAGCAMRTCRGRAPSCARSAQNRPPRRKTGAPTFPRLSRQLKGDLDAIALKALEKDRGRRYATPWRWRPTSGATCATSRSPLTRPASAIAPASLPDAIGSHSSPLPPSLWCSSRRRS